MKGKECRGHHGSWQRAWHFSLQARTAPQKWVRHVGENRVQPKMMHLAQLKENHLQLIESISWLWKQILSGTLVNVTCRFVSWTLALLQAASPIVLGGRGGGVGGSSSGVAPGKANRAGILAVQSIAFSIVSFFPAGPDVAQLYIYIYIFGQWRSLFHCQTRLSLLASFCWTCFMSPGSVG